MLNSLPSPIQIYTQAVVAAEAELVDTSFTVNSGDHVVKTIKCVPEMRLPKKPLPCNF